MYSTSTTESGLQDVSPDFYAWVFPKCDHVAVGTGTVIDKKGIQRPEICWSSESVSPVSPGSKNDQCH